MRSGNARSQSGGAARDAGRGASFETGASTHGITTPAANVRAATSESGEAWAGVELSRRCVVNVRQLAQQSRDSETAGPRWSRVSQQV
jgi:hypothetical protein